MNKLRKVALRKCNTELLECIISISVLLIFVVIRHLFNDNIVFLLRKIASVNLEKERFVAGSVVTFISSLYYRGTEINIQFYNHFLFKDPEAH